MRTRTAAFAALHSGDELLLLPNGWDYASIAGFAARGFAAVGTTSLGVAAAAGKEDAAGDTKTETIALARKAARLCLLTVDIEGGFSDDPRDIADLGRELADIGVVGVNVEDGMSGGELRDVDAHCQVIAALKDAGDLFVNARTDTVWLGGGLASLEETHDRLARYVEAGADGVFAPGVVDSEWIRALAELQVPLNLLYSSELPSIANLEALGVRRLSLGSLPFRVALGAALETADRIRTGEPPPDAPPYDEVQQLAKEA